LSTPEILRAISPATGPRAEFLHSLAIDLRVVGAQVSLVRRSKQLHFKCDLSGLVAGIGEQARQEIRRGQLVAARQFIVRTENTVAYPWFADGSAIDPQLIQPAIYICESDSERALYNYCRMLQGVPNNSRVGRQIKALVVDEGQAQPALIGVLGLASSLYRLKCRDDYLGWSGLANRQLREEGLRQIMDLAVCMAIPPYNFLLGAKFVAALSLSEPIAAAFEAKYGNRLHAVASTCATGIHCPIFNQVRVRPGGLFKRIGETAGYGTFVFSARTLRAARRLPANVSRSGYAGLNVLPVMRRGFRAFGFNPDVLLKLGGKKGVYLGALSAGAVQVLRGSGAVDSTAALSVQSAVAFWKRVIPNRQANPAVSAEMKRWRVSDLVLSGKL
jgi:uncharacterized protein DUF4338